MTDVAGSQTGKAPRPWWGDYDLEPGLWSRWLVGPLEFLARNSENEWRFAWRAAGDSLKYRFEFQPAVADAAIDESFEYRRYALESAGQGLRISPRLADRPMIVRPETALFLPPGETANLYVSTGVWLVAKPAREDEPELIEIPIFKASDTWFGRNTIHGELCYASITSARTDLHLLERVSHRAFTPIEISNRGKDALAVEALRVPVPMLALYLGEDGQLWTDKISFERDEGETAASLMISEHERMSSETSRRLCEPRVSAPSGLVHAFSKMFG